MGVTSSAGVRTMRLSEVAKRGVILEPAEAIAIVEGLCQTLVRTRTSPEPLIPDPTHIVLTSEGAVQVLDAERGLPLVPGVRLILELASQARPAQMRLLLFALESPSAPTFLDLLQVVGRAVSGDGQRLVAGVVERAHGQPSQPLSNSTPRRLPGFLRRVTSRRAVALGLMVVLLVGGAYFLARWPGSRKPIRQLLASRSAAGFSHMIVQGRSAVSDTVTSLGARLGIAPAPEPAPVASAAVELRRTPRARRWSSQPAPLTAPIPVEPIASKTLPVVASSAPVATASPLDSARDSLDASGAPVVYGSGDFDVTPPALLAPQLPTLPEGISDEQVSTIDLVIDAEGNVESARLNLPLKRWDHVMLLSAVKTWRFRPATRAGSPVSYRTSIRIPTSLSE